MAAKDVKVDTEVNEVNTEREKVFLDCEKERLAMFKQRRDFAKFVYAKAKALLEPITSVNNDYQMSGVKAVTELVKAAENYC